MRFSMDESASVPPTKATPKTAAECNARLSAIGEELAKYGFGRIHPNERELVAEEKRIKEIELPEAYRRESEAELVRQQLVTARLARDAKEREERVAAEVKRQLARQ